MRLIEENGYANTTVEQIAEAAEVSPSTFFRYFPSKEMVLMANDLDLVTIEALGQQPADMPSSAGVSPRARDHHGDALGGRVAVRAGPAADGAVDPELKAAQFDEYRRTVAALAEANNSMGVDPRMENSSPVSPEIA